MRDPNFYINQILFTSKTDTEWLALREEILRWLSEVDDKINMEFVESGDGEMLEMICDGIIASRNLKK